MTRETESKDCITCGHVEDAHEDGGDCQEEKCECTAYRVLADADADDDEPIPETPGPKA